jgi:glutamate N-acetyltransferase / amino-acid N-acetyltransferase
MNDAHFIFKGSVTTPMGFRACGVRAGLKKDGPDMALVMSDVPATAAALFTTNRIQAAPILVSKKHIENGQAQAILINAGNANACTGERGMADATEMAHCTARELHIAPDLVLVASTGIIGHFLPMDLVQAGIVNACTQLSYHGGIKAANAIMTTDLAPKHCAVEFKLDQQRCRIGGIAKGSGMIHPNLATMICVLTTDACITPPLLQSALTEAVDSSLNALTVDGETSTNDVVYLLANNTGSGLPIIGKNASYDIFVKALNKVTTTLAQAIARDGEGATKLVTVTVAGAADESEAKRAAKAVANSMLVKTAIFGRDPNWGRVVSAVGATGVMLILDKLTVQFAGITVFESGCAKEYNREKMHQALDKSEMSISVDLGAGNSRATVYTCDLTHGYITINAEYHT